MLINYAACRTNSHSACNNLVAAIEGWRYLTPECQIGGLDGRDREGLTWERWLKLLQRWWPVLVVGGGRRIILQKWREGGATTVQSMVEACWRSHWWRVVDLVADKLVVALVGGWDDGERKKTERGVGWEEKLMRKVSFFTNFGPDFLPSQAMKSTSI